MFEENGSPQRLVGTVYIWFVLHRSAPFTHTRHKCNRTLLISITYDTLYNLVNLKTMRIIQFAAYVWGEKQRNGIALNRPWQLLASISNSVSCNKMNASKCLISHWMRRAIRCQQHWHTEAHTQHRTHFLSHTLSIQSPYTLLLFIYLARLLCQSYLHPFQLSIMQCLKLYWNTDCV